MKKSVLLITLMLFSGNIWSMQNVNCSEANVLQQNRAHLLQLAKQLDVEEIDTQILEQLSQREIELRSMLDDLAQQYAEFNADQYAEHFGEQSEIANNFSFIQNALRASVQEINTIKDDCRPIFDQSIIVTGLLKLNSLKRFILDPNDISDVIDRRKYAETFGFRYFKISCPLLEQVVIEGIPSKDKYRMGMEYCFVKSLFESGNLKSFEISKEWWKETRHLIKKEEWDIFEDNSFVYGDIKEYISSYSDELSSCFR